MSDTASPPSDRTARGDLYYPWVALAVVCTWLMWASPGNETIPYHVGWIGLALLYGLGNWRLSRAVTGLALYTLATGVVLVDRAAAGVLSWQETAEIPLMSVLTVLMVWHVRRRQLALAELTVMAERDRKRAESTHRLTRLTSHEMRTPLTIARGYIELLLNREQEPDKVHDLAVVQDELDRLTRVTERLVRVIRLQGDRDVARVDMDAILRETAERWTQVADRHWVVEARAGVYEGSAERVRACLDTLIENAVRYTADEDTVRLIGARDADQIAVGVADSGPGLSDELIGVLNGSPDGDLQPPRDELSQTGLGLSLVRSLVTDRGGRIVAGRSAEGGALMLMVVPLGPRAQVPGELPDAQRVPGGAQGDELLGVETAR
ncbi:sensor histidine kinase [Cellulomonas sp. McL0617]|uniref:sensor histidine kinase n=1 Tax=Cellulomonas sp. McL0617 TaxID=3415675 RepID=UPI003CEEBBE5